MNKTAIRNFAIWARNKLIADIGYKAGLMGITAEGIAEALPQSTSDVEFYNIGTANPYAIQGEEIQQRKSLAQIIKQKQNGSDYETAYSSVIEEVAYTWFNRLIAVRFMEVNDYLPSHVRVLSSESGKQEPDLVTNPFDAGLVLSEKDKEDIILLKNDNKLDEVFNKLFIKQCNALYRILPRLFENMSDYTELLLNVSFVDQDGVVYHLVHDIDEDDFNVDKGGQVEIIGWLYQYYNAELKDETFALFKENIKVTKERIPSATQLFTPDWIVRYMVENSLGRLWLEGHPNDVLKEEWRYYLDEGEQREAVKEKLNRIYSSQAQLNLENIKIIDPCMGSGHILVYAFDVLMQIYESAGYSKRDATNSILKNNLFGLDIDDRAAQLAYFAVMMKAKQYNRRIFEGDTACNIFAIKESNGFDRSALIKFGEDLQPVAERLLDFFVDAKEYGSLVSVNLTLEELDALKEKLDDIDKMSEHGNLLDMMYSSLLCNDFNYYLQQAYILTQKYDVLFTNPPYMGRRKQNDRLAKYIENNTSWAKMDMFSAMIARNLDMVKDHGLLAYMTPMVWLYLGSYSDFRKEMFNRTHIINYVELENSSFPDAAVAICGVSLRKGLLEYTGKYFKLQNKNILEESEEFVSYSRDGKYYTYNWGEVANMPDMRIIYWMSESIKNAFETAPSFEDYAKPRQGMATSDNDRFLRLWIEPVFSKVGLGFDSLDSAMGSKKKWFPYNKGGGFRKWYGNADYVVNYENDGEEVKQLAIEMYGSVSKRIYNTQYFFKKSITWSDICGATFAARACKKGFIFDVKGSSAFVEDYLYEYVLAFLNSTISVAMLNMINPSITTQVGDLKILPLVYNEENASKITEIVDDAIEISRTDWDAYETSWDFKKHPLI